MTFVLTATKVLNILSKTLKDAVSGFFEFYSLREGGGLLIKSISLHHFLIVSMALNNFSTHSAVFLLSPLAY